MSHPLYDVVGIGIGPFNLGLAALGATVPELRLRCFDARPRFDWHPGMLIEGTTLQVPFLADLVTPADPTNPYSFLSYLKRTGRLYQFAIREAHFMSRKQYNQYCQWVCEQLPDLEFGTEIQSLSYDTERRAYLVEGSNRSSGATVRVHARNVVLGIGSVPCVPEWLPSPPPTGVLHSAGYLDHREALLRGRSVLIVGSGQSAAEVFYDLLQNKPDTLELTWLTRSDRLFPMDYSKFSLELASPDYVDHFHRLSPSKRRDLLQRQDPLYKGIAQDLLTRIYDLLYDRSLDGPRHDVHLTTHVELEAVETEKRHLRTRFRHLSLDTRFECLTEHLVLATGYEYRTPEFLAPLRPHIAWDEYGRPCVNRNYSLHCEWSGLFVQNAVPESLGFTSSDLSLGPYRNSVILNSVLGYEHFSVERRVAFQDFGVPENAAAERVGPARLLAPEEIRMPRRHGSEFAEGH